MSVYDELIDRANDIHAERKLGESWVETPREDRPWIHGDQAIAILEVVIEEVEKLRARLEALETKGTTV